VARNRDPEAGYYAFRAYARIGERDKALDLFERITRAYFPVYTFEHDPWLDSLRDSPRFAAIVREAGARHKAAQTVWEDAQ
jgi:hypothetical protein